MTTATGSRAGTLVVSNGFADEASIHLKDMVIKLKKTYDGQVVFRSRLTLRFVKGHKHNQSKDHVVALDSTLGPDHDSLNPLEMLLDLSLRRGAVQTTITDQLIAGPLTPRPNSPMQTSRLPASSTTSRQR